MSPQLATLQSKLREIFEFDHAEDLDFGIYRILNLKREQTTLFLNELLEKYVKDAFKPFEDKTKARILADLEELEKQAATMGIKPQDSPKYQEKQKQLLSAVDTQKTENEVYAHLAEFFGRYYDSGDFISLRRYKKDVYSIPYEGEEVKLHWANADQYYIKTTEYLSNYGFVVGGKKASFKFVNVDADPSANNKVSKEKERVFRLSETPISFGEGVGGEASGLLIYFTFEAKRSKDETQTKLLDEALETLKSNPIIINQYPELLAPAPTEKNKSRTVLEKHLSQYAARNTRDFFIHKNLEKFLSQELDFYLKNEVMFIDDLDTEKEVDVQVYLSKVKVIKRIGLKIIAMLAQVENFQKRLWLKKKFVLQSDWCFTLDRVPESYYPEILKNQKQIQAWIKLFWIQEIETSKAKDLYSKDTTGFAEVFDKDGNLLSGKEGIGLAFLKENSNLLIDTVFFTPTFKYQILADQDNLDEKMDGLLLQSENFQGLRFLMSRFYKSIKSIYVDPPYNTSASEILYKNSFLHSSWMSLIFDRVEQSKAFLNGEGLFCLTIDDFEKDKIRLLLDDIFSKGNHLGTIPIRNNPSGRSTAEGVSIAHEYALFYGLTFGSKVGRLDRSEKQIARYDEKDDQGPFEWVNFRKHGATREESPGMFYPIFISESSWRVPEMFWNESTEKYELLEEPNPDEIISLPIDENGLERRWKWGIDRLLKNPNEAMVDKDRSGNLSLYIKARLNEDGILPLTWWDRKEYSATAYGTNLLKSMFNTLNIFSYPKSIYAVEDSLRVLGLNNFDFVLDYFAGSATTGHGVINLNREDNGTRKYILIEMGEYFTTVTKPRIQKAIYSPDWKDGKPTTRNKPFNHAFKYLRLESYEDTLTNLAEAGAQLVPSAQQQALLAKSPALKEDYLVDPEKVLTCLNSIK